jgi:hypothetical protein
MPPPTLIFAERNPRSNHFRASAAASCGETIEGVEREPLSHAR